MGGGERGIVFVWRAGPVLVYVSKYREVATIFERTEYHTSFKPKSPYMLASDDECAE